MISEKTFNEKVKCMYKDNESRDNLKDIHMVDNDTAEYTDGKVLVRAKNQRFLDDREAEIKKCPKIGSKDMEYPNTDKVFPKTEIISTVCFQKKTLLKVLALFNSDDAITFHFRAGDVAVEFSGTDSIGLIMPCRRSEIKSNKGG